MHVEVRASNGVESKKSLDRFVETHLAERLGRFQDEIVSVEAQFTDENHEKGGAGDKRCMLEARIPPRERLAVTHRGQSVDQAFRGACAKLARTVERELGRQDRKEHRHRETIRRGEPAAESGGGIQEAI